MLKADDRLRISAVPTYIYGLTGEWRARRTVDFWTRKGLDHNGGKLKLKSEKICGIIHTRKSWVNEFLEEMNR